MTWHGGCSQSGCEGRIWTSILRSSSDRIRVLQYKSREKGLWGWFRRPPIPTHRPKKGLFRLIARWMEVIHHSLFYLPSQQDGWKGFPFTPSKRYIPASLTSHLRLTQVNSFATSHSSFPTRRRPPRSPGEGGPWRCRLYSRLSSHHHWTRRNQKCAWSERLYTQRAA
jgi:hypothetical protein